MDDSNPFEAKLLSELGHVQVLGQTDDHTVLLHDRQRRALLRLRNLESLWLATAVQLLGPRVLDIASDKESLSRLRVGGGTHSLTLLFAHKLPRRFLILRRLRCPTLGI